MKTCLLKYTEKFTTKKKKKKKKKNENFQIKILIFFHISAQNIDLGYSRALKKFSMILNLHYEKTAPIQIYRKFHLQKLKIFT